MIFKTFDSDIDNMSSRWGMFGKSFSDIGDTITTKWKQVTDYVAVTNDATISGMMSAWKGTSPVQFLSDDSVVNVLNDYNKALDKGAEATVKFFETGTGNDFMNGWLKQLKGAPATMDDYKAAVAKAELAQNGLTASMVASKVAALALNVAVSMGVSIAISALIKLVDNLVHANEKAIEKAEELRDKYNDFKETNASNVKTLNDLKDEFEELSDGVSQYGDNISLTTEQYARYQEIVQQIVGISPSLAEGYDTENGYIADKNGLLERAIELQEIEYKNELRKITNLDNLKTSMSGYIAEYKEALNGGYITSEGNIIGTTIDTDFKNSLWKVFNTNNRDNYDGQSMAKDIMESLGVKDIDKEIEKYINEYGYWQDSDFWNDYCDKIVSNLDVVTNSLTAEEVGLDDTIFDQNIEKLESYAEQYSDMKDSVKSANESIQTDLGYIAEYADGYSDLSKEQQKFVTDYLKGFDISDITSENSMGILEYDEDKMASVKSQIKKFVEELSHDDSTKQALTDLYAPPSDNETVEEYKNRIDSALEVIRKYCEANGIEIPVGISDVEDSATGLESSYKQTIENAKEKYGEDLTPFFKENSINTQEEIDKWREIAQSCNTATEAKKKYLEADISKETPISSTDILTQVQALSDGLDQLDKIYADVYNKEDFDWSSILNNDGFKEEFGNMTNVTEEYKNAYDDFIKTISNNPSDLSACQSAFDNLATAYIYNSDALKNVTEDTKASTIAMLEQMGIANAEEVVTAQIANNLLEARAATLDFASATDADINSLVAYANQLGLTAADVAQLCLKQIDVSNNPIKTQASLANLQSLISMAGVTGDKLTYLLKMINAVNNVASLAASGKATQSQITAAGRIVENLQGQMKNISTANVKPQVSYSGGTSTKSAIDKANKSSGSSSKDSKETKETFNWVETAISRIQRAVTNLGKIVSATYKSWSTRNSALSSEMSAVTQEISVQQSAYQAYMDKANSVGLSDYYKNLVQNGGMSIEDVTDDTLKEQIQTYKEYYEKALAASDAVQDLRDNLAELAKTKFDNLAKEYDNKISDIDHVVTTIENEVSGVEKLNKIAGKSFYTALIEQENQRLKDLEEKKSSLLSAINESVYNGSIEYGSEQWHEMKSEIDSVDESIQDANNSLIEYKENLKEVAKLNFDNLKEQFENALSIITDGSDLVDAYISQTEASGEIVGKSFYSAMIDLKNADINGLKKQYETLSSTLSEAMANGDVSEFDSTWYSMTSEINSVEKSIVETNTELIELRKNLKEVDKLKFDSLVSQFDTALSQIEHESSKLNSVISIIDESGYVASSEYYDVLITTEKSNADVLLEKYNQLKTSLQEALDNGSVTEFDDNWASMVSDIQDTEDALLKSKEAIIQYQNAQRQIQWDLFDRMQASFANLADESDFLIELMGKNSKLYDDNGQMNSNGLSVQGLHALNYDNYINQVKEYKNELAEIQGQLAADPKNTTLIDRYAELLKAQHSAILNAEDEKSAIIDLISDGYDKLLDSLQDVIDKRKEALNAEKDLYDYQKNISKLSETKTNIEKQLAVYASGSDSEELKATIQKLQKNLTDANEDLADAEYDKYLSDQQEILDTLYDNTQEWINTRLDNIDGLFQEAIETTNANSDRIAAEIQADTTSVGASLSEEMHVIWEDGGVGHNVVQGTTDAINALYGYTTTTAQTAFDGIKANTLDLATKFSMVTNEGIATALTNINNATVYASAIMAKTSEISGSLTGTIANKIDGVTTAIGSIKTAITEMGTIIATAFSNAVSNLSNSYNSYTPTSTQATTTTSTQTETNGSGTTTTNTKTTTDLKPGKPSGTIKKPTKTVTSNSGGSGKQQYLYNIATRYANGGNVSSKTKSPFDDFAKSIGEDTMVAVQEGERILTPVQNEAFETLVANLSKFDASQLYQTPTIPKLSNPVLNNIGTTNNNDIRMEIVFIRK